MARKPVRRRKVFYVPGYDPRPPRRYRELYRSEGAAQADVSGFKLEVARSDGQDGGYGWQARGIFDGQVTEARFEVLEWADLVKDSMRQGIVSTYLQLVSTAWIYLSSGALRRLTWLRKGPVIAALYPVAVLIAELVAAIAVAALAGWAAAALIWPGAFWVAALPGVVLALRGFRAIDDRVYAHYLMHDYAFSAGRRGANPPALDARLRVFQDRIARALASDVDEVLVVGHSSGVHLAVHVLAALVRDGRVPANGPALGFLSLGQVVPMVSFLPAATQLRADLHALAVARELTWVDVSAPGDGCAFALCDPVAVSGVAPPGQLWPLVISAAFTQTLSPQRFAALRWRFFRLHFQYLCAFDRPGDYDYFSVTAGPLTLGDRYAGRAPSQSRIDVPASPHTSMVA